MLNNEKSTATKRFGKFHKLKNEQNKEALKICAINKNYTVRPTTIISNSPLSEVKMNLTSGSIIALPINQTVEKELPVIIEYIKGKGYKIENLYNHLNEAS